MNKAARVMVCATPVIVVVVLNVVGSTGTDPMLRLLASLVCCIATLPFVFHVAGRKGSLPFMPIYALLFGGFFGAPVFLDEKFALTAANLSLSDPVMVDAMAVILVGFLTLLAGYYFLTDRVLRGIPRMRRGLDDASGVQMGWSMVSLGILTIALRGYIPMRFSALGQVTEELGILGLTMLFYYYLQGRLQGPQGTAIPLLIVGMAIFSISGGGIGPVVQQIVLPLVGTYWIVRRRFIWKTSILFALIIIPISGVKGQFREVAWADTSLNVVERSALFFDLINEGFRTQDDFYHESFQVTVRRMNMITTLAAVQTLTPSVIPYWGGASYATLYWAVIPRFLYPDKPQKLLGQDFGHRYGLLDKFDKNTSYNFPQLVEFYANFGFWGVAFGMMIIGLLFRLVYYFVTAPDADPSVTLFAVILLAQLCHIDSDFSLIFGGLILNCLFIVVAFRILRARRIYLPLDFLRFR